MIPKSVKRFSEKIMLKQKINLESDSAKLDQTLVLLHHKFLRAGFLAIEVLQHGHRDKVLASATINRRRMVATELGMWRSGRNGGTSGSVTVGNGKFLEQRGGTRS